MDRRVEVSSEAFIEQMTAEFKATMTKVIEAVNKAPDGQWINASEHPVRDAIGEFRTRAFEVALQMKIDLVEGDFSPGGLSDNGEKAEQGRVQTLHDDDQRSREHVASSLPQQRRRHRNPKR